MMTTIQTPIDTVDLLMWLRRRDTLQPPCPLTEHARIRGAISGNVLHDDGVEIPITVAKSPLPDRSH